MQRKTPDALLLTISSISMMLLALALTFVPVLAQEPPPTPSLQGDDLEVYGQENVTLNPLTALQGDDNEIFVSAGEQLTNPLMSLQGDDSEIYGDRLVASPLMILQGDDAEVYGAGTAIAAVPAASAVEGGDSETTEEPEPVTPALSEMLPLPDQTVLAQLPDTTGGMLPDTASIAWTQVTINYTFMIIGLVIAVILLCLGGLTFLFGRQST